MTLQEILRMISMKTQHSYGDVDIIAMVNDEVRIIFRTMYKQQTATTYDLLEGNPFYPISFAPESIIDVVVNGKEYPYQNIKYDAQCYYYYITETDDDIFIGIYPTPSEYVERGITVFRYQEPRELSVNNLSDTPDLDPAWHMMIVSRVCKRLASIPPINNDLLNILNAEISNLEKQFYQSRAARPHRIQDVYGVGRGAI